ncbi:hypothetical protein BH11VER1_BH11VER1_33780 [soil metagenome]
MVKCQLGAGHFLAFLNRDGELWVGANWHLSLRPVKDGEIAWYVDPDRSRSLAYQRNDSVLNGIQELLAESAKTKG